MLKLVPEIEQNWGKEGLKGKNLNPMEIGVQKTDGCQAFITNHCKERLVRVRMRILLVHVYKHKYLESCLTISSLS